MIWSTSGRFIREVISDKKVSPKYLKPLRPGKNRFGWLTPLLTSETIVPKAHRVESTDPTTEVVCIAQMNVKIATIAIKKITDQYTIVLKQLNRW